MSRPVLEVADIFRDHGAAWREANRGHVSLGQLKVMSAIERCRTAALGGHVARCENDACARTVIAFNSCRNRHCPKCQGSAAREWLAEREAELLPVPYFHVVYTLPAPIADIAYQNKAQVYGILFKASAETTLRIAADPKRLGARIGITSVLHTWGSAMTHHPHVHMIVPGGGLSADGRRWIAGRVDYLLVGNAENEFPMIQADFVRKQSTRRKVTLTQGGGYNHDERDQNQNQETDQEGVGTNLTSQNFLVGGHLFFVSKGSGLCIRDVTGRQRLEPSLTRF